MSAIDVRDEPAMEQLGAGLAARYAGGGVVYLRGELGAGKTTFVRGFMRGAGHGGTVKSPTFTLVEPYTVAGRRVYHFDLYRLNDPGELEYLGIRDYVDAEALCLIEWPQRGAGRLPPPDLTLCFDYRGDARRVAVVVHTPRGGAMAAALKADDGVD